jgi:hypothetical protein
MWPSSPLVQRAQGSNVSPHWPRDTFTSRSLPSNQTLPTLEYQNRNIFLTTVRRLEPSLTPNRVALDRGTDPAIATPVARNSL